MLRATEAAKIAEANRYKIQLQQSLLLDYIISRIRHRAKEGFFSLDFDISKNRGYYECYRPLIDLGYKVVVKRNKFYISW